MACTLRYIYPHDHEKQTEIPFSLAELKTLQNIVLDKMNVDPIECLPHRELAQKLEYYITELE